MTGNEMLDNLIDGKIFIECDPINYQSEMSGVFKTLMEFGVEISPGAYENTRGLYEQHPKQYLIGRYDASETKVGYVMPVQDTEKVPAIDFLQCVAGDESIKDMTEQDMLFLYV